MPRDDPHEFHRLVPLNNGDVIGRLEVEPEIGRCAEVAGQPGSGIRSNGTALVDNISYAGCGDAEGDGKRMGRDVHRLQEFFPQDFSRMCADAHGISPTALDYLCYIVSFSSCERRVLSSDIKLAPLATFPFPPKH